MNFTKIRRILSALSYVDQRGLICYSNANRTTTTNYVVFMKVSTVRQDNLPSFMILSICDDKLHISKAGIMGGFKEYYGSIDLKDLTFKGSYSKDFIYTYEFSYDMGYGKTRPFYINSSFEKKEVVDVVNAIIQFKHPEFPSTLLFRNLDDD
jgi:hypothetical protein